MSDVVRSGGDGASVPESGGPSREELRELYESKAHAEVATANDLAPGADVIATSGNVLAQVALVKGLPGPAEAGGGAALCGPDGAAADAALLALGYDPAAAFRILSRPDPALEAEKRALRLRYAVEAVDPIVIVALDAEAAEDLREAFAIERLAFGQPLSIAGRKIVAVDGLEASLVDPNRKKRVWRQLKSIGV